MNGTPDGSKASGARELMNTFICRTCGCSLVRLGISEEQSARSRFDGQEYRFCCEGCTELFATAPEKYLEETSDLIVCPTCLAEKPMNVATMLDLAGREVHFCRCPYCVEVFQKNPDFYLQRLEGIIPNDGVLDHEGCCVRPE